MQNRKRFFFITVTIFVILAAIGAVASYVIYRQFKGAAFSQEQAIYVVDSNLEQEVLPLVNRKWGFKKYAERLNLKKRLKRGYYEFSPEESVISVVRRLALGDQNEVQLTFNNVRTIPQLAGKLTTNIALDSISMLNALLEWNEGDTTKVFTTFIPNTYSVFWTTSPEQIFSRMSRESANFWNSSRLARLEDIGLTKEEAITLASIVYEETKHISEMPRVAGVYMNRLRIKMALQADPTVRYALQDFEIKRVLNKHLKYDSPYNTYRYKGLPPSPIAMPSIAAIDAVLNFEKHDYLYFCANPSFDGFHAFSKSYSEHLKNAREYSKELNNRGIR